VALDELVATLGACLAAVRQASRRIDLRGPAGLRRLAEQLEPAGMQVLDDGSHVQLGPNKRFHGAAAHLVQPQQLPRLTQEQADILAIVIMDGMATRRRIEEVRGAAQLSIGPEGPLSLPPRQLRDAGRVDLPRPALRRLGRASHWAAPGLPADAPIAATTRGGHTRGGAGKDGGTGRLAELTRTAVHRATAFWKEREGEQMKLDPGASSLGSWWA
jgi:Segregation and condensation complex subunit ScpB